jgi:hypothetical protein
LTFIVCNKDATRAVNGVFVVVVTGAAVDDDDSK